MRQIAIAGNPNTGKTTLFNQLTGASARVGNYPGITVERRQGRRTVGGEAWRVVDLPGCYSLIALSPEEEIAHHALTGRYGDGRPDVVVVVLDANNLARNLSLLLQVAEYGLPVVGALNMMDEAEQAGVALDVDALQQALGCPLVPMVARHGEGLAALEAAIADVLRDPSLGTVTDTAWPESVSQAIAAVRDAEAGPVAIRQSGEALWWIGSSAERVEDAAAGADAWIRAALAAVGLDRAAIRAASSQARFARIDALLATMQERQAKGPTWTERIDRIVLHPVLGVLTFLAVMGALFQAVFAGVDPAIDAIDAAGGAISGAVGGWMAEGLLRDVVVDGVLAGVAGTLVFVPQIAVLFLGVALLEDSGYLARAAVLMDRLLGRAGLPGTAFVPLLSSFACNVPGIMATRTMANPSDRLVTMLVAPLMSCAARLPVYTMVTAAVFAGTAPLFGFLSVGGLLISAMYLAGLLLALLVAMVLRRTVARGARSALLLELPPYRLPRTADVLRVVWTRVWTFVRETGSIIVALTIVLWALMSFPAREPPPELVATWSVEGKEDAAARKKSAWQLEHSAAGTIGKAVEPVIAPLGFDWRIGIGLVGSFAAREVLVPVMGRVYGRGDAGDDDDVYQQEVGHSMVRVSGMTPLVGVALMVFFAVAMQCMSTLAVIVRETQSWRWGLLSLGYLNGLAWLLAFATRQLGLLLGWGS
ncbi:MAG: ferrous iron transport protein B [Deltaproteobacteria bacterium]|nr:ferrous iron transport protein B [Deltaproteobacteria bacterium]